MNIETANRLYQYRKANNLSQEELAEKIGVSRQAISKWERAEASPDTDNLIMIAKVYGVSLDTLILGEENSSDSDDEKSTKNNESANTENEQSDTEPDNNDYYKNSKNGDKVHIGLDGIHIEEGGENGDKVHIGWKGIHVEEGRENGDTVHVGWKGIHVEEGGENGDTVHVGWKGIHVEEGRENGDTVHIDKNGIRVEENGEKVFIMDENGHIIKKHKNNESKAYRFFKKFPFAILAVIAFLAFGFLNIFGGWATSWLIFLTIPIYDTLITAIFTKNPKKFSFTVLAILIFFILGFGNYLGGFAFSWIVFLTIPIYYWLASFISEVKNNDLTD